MTPAVRAEESKKSLQELLANTSGVHVTECDACGKRCAGTHSHEWTLENGVPDGSFCCSCMRCEFDCFADALPFVPGVL